MQAHGPRAYTFAEGDLAVCYMANRRTFTYLKRGQDICDETGSFPHDSIIGKPFGSVVYCKRGRSRMVAIACTPEIWSKELPHRTQVLYATDMASVMTRLNIKNGDMVIETGTGSGSLTSAFARAVAPKGQVHTFDFNQSRVEAAQVEFAKNRLADVVTCRWGDATAADAFKAAVESTGRLADAVFLDIPKPWDAVERAKKVLRPGGRVCCFSPCIEQVQRSCLRLAQLGFVDIRTIEAIEREFKVVPRLAHEAGTEADFGLPAAPGPKRLRAEAPANPAADGDGVAATPDIYPTDHLNRDLLDALPTADRRIDLSRPASRDCGDDVVAGERRTGKKSRGQKRGRGASGADKRAMEEAAARAGATVGLSLGERMQLVRAVERTKQPSHTGYLTFAVTFEGGSMEEALCAGAEEAAAAGAGDEQSASAAAAATPAQD